MELIKLEKISFAYAESRPVLKDLSFQLNQGERVGLIGTNGCGKTTLFHLIMGLLKPGSGTIKLFGKEIKDERDFRPARKRIGLLFQDADDQLFSPTVLEDVAFGPLNQGKSTREAKAIAAQTLTQLGLDGFEDRITHQLSGGEKKLVSLATILAMQPEVLLLDEPTTGLDWDTRDRIIKIISEIDMAYVLISHNIDFLSQTTTKTFSLQDGSIHFEKTKIPHTHTHAHEFGQIDHIHTHGDEGE